MLLLALLAPIANADEPPTVDYSAHIQPLLTKYCAGCHSTDDAEGGLILESYAGLVAGGKRGAALVAGSSDRSRMWRMVSGLSELRMPPEDNPAPSADELALIKTWLDAGAPGPSGTSPPSELRVPAIASVGTARRPIQALAFTKDGRSLLLTDVAEVRQLSLASRTIERTLSGPRTPITALALSTDGQRLVSAGGQPGMSGEVRLWNLSDGTLLREFTGHRDAIYAAALSADGATLATSSYDQQIILWDPSTGTQLRTLDGHTDAVYDVAFSPDGRFLASAAGDRTVKLWRVADGTRLDTFGQPLKEVYSVAFDPRGRALAAGGVDNRIRLWDLSESAAEGTNTLRISRFAHEGPILRVVYAPDGKTLASSSQDGSVKLWDTATLDERLGLAAQSDWPTALAFSPSGNELAIGRQDGTFDVVNVDNGQSIPAAAPKLVQIAPRSVRPGDPVRWHAQGENLAGVTRVEISGRTLDAKPVTAEGESLAIGASLSHHETWLAVTIPADLPLGIADLKVETQGGLSGTLKVLVDELPQLAEMESESAPEQVSRVALPFTISGTLQKQGDVDSVPFDASAGQTVVAQFTARELGSKASGVLSVVDADGHTLADSLESDPARDPLLVFTAPATGSYTLRLSDRIISGSAEHHYALSVGSFSLVTDCFPLGIPADQPTDVELIGHNLPPGTNIQVQGKAGQVVDLPMDRAKLRFMRPLKVVVSTAADSRESEPNEESSSATAMSVPATVQGRFLRPADSSANNGPDTDVFRFSARAGESWIVETDAAGRGAPTDTRIEILTADGQPVPRIVLQATRDSYVTFRGIDSINFDVRLANWEEMELNEFVYFNGEVSRLLRMPQGPDSGFNLYHKSGTRLTWFDTSPTAHALDEPCYTVVPHPIGAKLAANGLPTFTLHYANDDDGLRELGRDSRLTFTAPADGDYLVRVTEVQQRTSPRHAYRLTIRHPQPDFEVSLAETSVATQPGGARELIYNVRRIDGFSGDVRVSCEGFPPGWSVPSPVVIEAGLPSARASLSATAEAAAPDAAALANLRFTATGDVNGSPVTKPFAGLTAVQITTSDKRILVKLEPSEVTIAPGGTTTARIVIERHGVEGPVNFDVNNLPHGVIVDNIGLNGVLIPQGQSEREVIFHARAWVPETTRPVHALAASDGNEASHPIVFHVRRATSVARADDADLP